MNKSFKVLLIYPNLMMINLLPTNISILSACLKEKNFNIKLFDTTMYKTENQSPDEIRVENLQLRPFNLSEKGVFYKQTDAHKDFKNIVSNFKPDLIAISLVEDTYPIGISLLNSIKDCKIPVIAGGIYPTFAPDKLINEEAIDIICLGEGESALVELCEKMRDGLDYKNIKNLWIKDNGRIIKNPMGPLVDINKLPFSDFSIFEEKRIYRPMQGKLFRMLPVEIDRGCPYFCAFCAAPSLRELYANQELGRYHRYKNIERVMAEINYYIENYKMDYVYFNSETFLAQNLDYLKEFARAYKKVDLPFWCQTRVETITDEKIKILKEMHCDRVSVGVEHGNEEFRKKVLKKTMRNEQIIEAFKILKKYSIPVTVNNIIGFPDETRDMIFETIELSRNIQADSMNAFIFNPYRGTILHKVCSDKGYINENTQTATLAKYSVLNMPHLKREEIQGLLRTFCLYVKMPENRWADIKIAEKFDEEGNRAFQKLRKEYYDNYLQKV